MSTELRVYGNEVARLIPKLVNDETKVPQFILTQDSEFHAINGASKDYGKEFGCNFEVIVAENSKETKARQALPGKAAILIE